MGAHGWLHYSEHTVLSCNFKNKSLSSYSFGYYLVIIGAIRLALLFGYYWLLFGYYWLLFGYYWLLFG